MKFDTYIYKATNKTGITIIRNYDRINIQFTDLKLIHKNTENNILDKIDNPNVNECLVSLNTSLKKKTQDDNKGVVANYETGIMLNLTQEKELLNDFIKTVETNGMDYVKNLQFTFLIVKGKGEQILKYVRSYDIIYSKNVKD